MPLPRFVQVLGLAIVTYVMIRSYVVSSMAFQFGGLAVGVAVFLIGRGLQARERR